MEDYYRELYEELTNEVDVIMKIYPTFKKIKSLPMAISVVMVMLDNWAADHDVDDEEVNEILKRTIEDVRPDVFEMLGRAEKSPEEHDE